MRRSFLVSLVAVSAILGLRIAAAEKPTADYVDTMKSNTTTLAVEVSLTRWVANQLAPLSVDDVIRISVSLGRLVMSGAVV